MLVLSAIGLVMVFFVNGALKYYMYLIRTLQLIFHLVIFKTSAPANVQMVSSFIIPVANFDFQIEDFLGMIFSFSDDGIENFPLNFELIGYGNNAITNMGSIFLANIFQNIMIIVFVLLIIFGLTKEFKTQNKYVTT